MQDLNINNLQLNERLQNPDGIKNVFKDDIAKDLSSKIRDFLGKYSGIAITNKEFESQLKYTLVLTNKKIKLEMVKDEKKIIQVYNVDYKKLTSNNHDVPKEKYKSFFKKLKKISKDVTEKKASMWNIKKPEK